MKKFKKRIMRTVLFISTVILMLSLSALTVYAEEGGGGGGDAGVTAWDNVMDFIVPWIGRLGGAIMLVGGVMFALGWKNDDVDGRARGLQTLIAGAIVVAVGVSSDIFLQ